MVLWACLAFPYNDKGLQYLNVGTREDSHSAVVLSFIPVLIDLLINVNNISLLQRKLPVDRGSEHFSRCFNTYYARLRYLILAKGDFKQSQRGQIMGRGVKSDRKPLFRKSHHVAHFVQSFAGGVLTHKLSSTWKFSEALLVYCCLLSAFFVNAICLEYWHTT